MTSVLPAVLLLAVIDSVNPASITAAVYLARSGRMAPLTLFIFAVYSTYLSFGLALTLGPAAALRSALAGTPTILGPAIEVAVGGVLVAMGVRTWRTRASPRLQSAPSSPSTRRSALALGVLTTVADLPTAGPLLVATALLAAATTNTWAQVTDLCLYNVVYISPLLGVALIRRWAATAGNPTNGRSAGFLVAFTCALAGLCVAGGTMIGCEGIAALL